jgi:hypothetical protein
MLTPLGVQVPLMQALFTPQDPPFGPTGLEHRPEMWLHTPIAWHWSLAAHNTGAAPTHTPAWHVSDFVQALPSLQVKPFCFAGLEHSPEALSQTPAAWH